MDNLKKEAMHRVVDGLLRICRQVRRDLDLLESFEKSLPVSRVRHDLTDVVYGVYDIKDSIDEL